MIKADINTTSIKEAGLNILSLKKEYDEIIEAMFNKINAYETVNIWIGSSSRRYIALTNTEKSYYDTLGKVIDQYGKALVNSAENYDDYLRGARYND